MHLIKSSSMPPQVVTIASTILCSHKYLNFIKVLNDFTHARGNAVAGVAQENGAPLALLAAPLDHVVELINGQTQVGRLNTHRLVARKYLGVVHALVEIVTLHHIVRYCQVRFVVS